MAIIQKIRDKYAKVAGGVIVLSLVGFVLMDATSGGRSSGGLFGSGTTVAKIDGDKIDVTEYEALVNAQEEQMRAQNRPTDENANAQLRDQVMNQMVMQKLIDNITGKLGVTVSEGELKEMLNTANPDPMVRQAFTNPQTGQFNPEEATQAIAQYERSKDAQAKLQWENFKKDLAASKTANKLNALLSGSFYTPKFVLDDQADGKLAQANVSYVSLPYSAVADDKVKVTDEDINKYIASKKSMFEVKEEMRGIDFVTFSIAPSTEDSNRVRTDLEGLKEGLSTATDADAYVKRNSSVQLPVAFQSEESLAQMQLTDKVAGVANGAVVGPFAFGQDMAIAKVLSRAQLNDTVKVRHILVATKQGGMEVRSEAQAQARIDSIIALEKSGVPFDSLIARFSDDNIAQNPKGEYELPLANRSGYTKPFGDYAFSGAPVGASKAVTVNSTNYSGIHYIQILGKSAKTVNATELAIVVKPLIADKNTYSTIYANASAFANKVAGKNSANFEKEATTSGLQLQSAPGLNKNSSVVSSLGASKEIVRWAFEAKKDDVSPTFTIGGNKIVVAKLKEINEPGLLKPSGNTKMSIENLLKQHKKAQILIDANKGKDLASIASGNQTAVATQDSVSFAGAGGVIGSEPKAIGYIFNKNFKENTVSPGIAGMNSVYFVSVSNRQMPKAENRDVKTERLMSDAMMKGRAAQMILEGLRNSAEVEDLRYKLYK